MIFRHSGKIYKVFMTDANTGLSELRMLALEALLTAGFASVDSMKLEAFGNSSGRLVFVEASGTVLLEAVRLSDAFDALDANPDIPVKIRECEGRFYMEVPAESADAFADFGSPLPCSDTIRVLEHGKISLSADMLAAIHRRTVGSEETV